jgi:hypothetical protein
MGDFDPGSKQAARSKHFHSLKKDKNRYKKKPQHVKQAHRAAANAQQEIPEEGIYLSTITMNSF